MSGVLQFRRGYGDDAVAQTERPRRSLESHLLGAGNEMDGPWQMGQRSAEDYGKFALEAAKLMKWTDPSVKLIAAGSSNFTAGSDWTSWNRTVLDPSRTTRITSHCTPTSVILRTTTAIL